MRPVLRGADGGRAAETVQRRRSCQITSLAGAWTGTSIPNVPSRRHTPAAGFPAGARHEAARFLLSSPPWSVLRANLYPNPSIETDKSSRRVARTFYCESEEE